MVRIMKKYTYYYEDIGLTIEADNGKEAEKLYYESHEEAPTGRIRVTNNETGHTNVLLPIVFAN